MSAGERLLPNRRWLDWRPSGPTIADSPGSEPTKPSKLGFEGSVGPTSVDPANIEPERIPSCGPKGEHPEISHRGNSDCPAPNERQGHSQPAVDCSSERERVMSWADWQAANLNRLFVEQGLTGQPGRITGDTVRHGQRKQLSDE